MAGPVGKSETFADRTQKPIGSKFKIDFGGSGISSMHGIVFGSKVNWELWSPCIVRSRSLLAVISRGLNTRDLSSSHWRFQRIKRFAAAKFLPFHADSL
ncbi:hypothetical protein CDAR_441891 [Caerostris darwini]|uniref:Uncharacterized protein n=1 Tax=Caerostris darwini TaxID=1538125 RepID=A0AAV4VX62_9ARAC|nr:hypothetical protein CDAR_441891 [Caerostris darwini]